MKHLAILLLLVFSVGCPKPIPEPNEPDDPEPTTLCGKVCAHYRDMKCEEGEKTAEGHECEEVCNNNSEIPGIEEYYECVLTKKDCVTINDCD